MVTGIAFLVTFICFRRLKMSPLNVKLDLHYNGEVLSAGDDRKLIGQIPFKDRTVSETSFCCTVAFALSFLFVNESISAGESCQITGLGTEEFEGMRVVPFQVVFRCTESL